MLSKKQLLTALSPQCRAFKDLCLVKRRDHLRILDVFHLSTFFFVNLSGNIRCHSLEVASANDINEPKLDLPLCAGLLQGTDGVL